MYFTKYDMTDTFAHNTHGTGGRPFNTSGIWELPPTYIQRLIKYTVCFLACRADENALHVMHMHSMHTHSEGAAPRTHVMHTHSALGTENQAFITTRQSVAEKAL